MTAVAICGYGVVGSGVGYLCREQADTISSKRSVRFDVKYVFDRRSFPEDPFGDRVVSDLDLILQDSEVEIIIETMGGTGIAYEITKKALMAGKHVVSSNKELVSIYGAELLKLAKEHHVYYRFEAAVGGGIPLLATIREDLAANDVNEITGILNGTCNYILTRMGDGECSFEEALTEAQGRGYAERNPHDDVEGIDTCRKLAILASMCSGEWISPEFIHTEGISTITKRDAELASSLGCVVKLVGRLRSRGTDSHKQFELRVAPTLVPQDYPLAIAKDVYNAVYLQAYPVDNILLYGKGAGSLPTASAVLGDMIELASKEWKESNAEVWGECAENRVVPFGDCCTSAIVRVKKQFGASELSNYLRDLGGFRLLNGPFVDEYVVETTAPELREGRLESAVQNLPEGACLQVIRRI